MPALQIGRVVGLLFAAAGVLCAWLVGRSPEDALTYGLYGLFIGVLERFFMVVCWLCCIWYWASCSG